jgi:hypothetical protein
MSELPTSDLELRAAEERRRLQVSLDELKERVRETLDLEQNVRHHPLLISGIAAVTAATIGYKFAGLFSRTY